MREVDLGGFTPFNDAHAIFACTLSLTFFPQPPSVPVPWNKIQAAAKKFGLLTGFSAARPTFGMNMTVDQSRLLLGIDRPVSSISEVLGLDFQRVGDNLELLDRVTIATDQLTVQTHSYVRWQALFDQWKRLISEVSPFYADRAVGGVRLEYWDRFDSDTANIDVHKLLRQPSPYVASSSISNDAFWNCATNINRLLGSGARRSLQTKVEVGLTLGKPQGRTLLIQTVCQDFFGGPLQFGDAARPDWEPFRIADAQHDLLKNVLGEVISDAAIDRIALRAEPDV